jgi:hypothetical protein
MQSIYTFFLQISECHIEFIKLAYIMEIKGNKLFCNIKIRWISMLNPLKHVFEEY